MRTILGMITAGLLVSSAMAADIPTKGHIISTTSAPTYNWTGFYLGGNAGYDRQAGTTTQSATGVFGPLFPAANGGAESGVEFGLQAGYRYQLNPMWVLGVEGDFDWLRHNSNATSSAALGGISASTATSASVDWVTTLRGTVGFVPPGMSNVLAYFTGGAAWGKSNVSLSSNLTPGCVVGCGSAQDSSVKSGWVLGGGLEVAFAKNWSLRGEYQHIDLGNVGLSYKGTGPAAIAPTFNSTTGVAIDLIRVGINYKFNTL